MTGPTGDAAIAAARSEPESGPLIQLRGVEKTFRSGRMEYRALQGIDLDIGAGDFTAVVGPSGSGKSTILNIMTGIDRPTAGTVTVGGRRIDEMSEEDLAVWRGETVGIVFQFFQLLPTLTALENAMLPLDFAAGGGGDNAAARATHNLERVGLGDKADHMPMELSGGEQQRVAIARALARDPSILVADEPTGNLDTDTAARVLDLLGGLNSEGTTVLYVTHDTGLAAHARRTVTVRDGRVVG
jgi:putative ABC transport system ATP-binding protein